MTRDAIVFLKQHFSRNRFWVFHVRRFVLNRQHVKTVNDISRAERCQQNLIVQRHASKTRIAIKPEV